MEFTVIVPFYNGYSTIDRLIQSIPKTIEIVVVDDRSNPPLESLPYPNVKIIRSTKGKGFFAGAVNLGIVSTRGGVLVLNQDTYFTGNGWLKQLEEALASGYSYIGERIKGTRHDWPFGYIHGTFMYLTRELIDRTGLLNQVDFPMWGCTAEYQLRAARNNFKILPIETVVDFVHLRKDGQQFGESFATLVQAEKENVSLFVQTPPLVSVIIPVHNYGKWLSSTINSLVGGPTDLGHWKQQTFGAFEVLIVDDSSTDNTPEIIKDLTDPWKGVRSIRLNRSQQEVWDSERNKYIGKVYALNTGISECYGKYIMVLDADDMVHSDRIERFYREQKQRPHNFIYDNLQLFGGGKILEYTYPETLLVMDRDNIFTHIPHPKAGQTTLYPQVIDYDFEKLIYKNHVHNSIMFPVSAWKEIGGYPDRFIYGREDWAIAVRLGIHGYCGYRISDYHGLLYRREGQNRTLDNTRPEWMRYFQTQMRKEFGSIYKGERPMGCCGNGAKATRNQAFARGARLDVASEGTTWLRYTGRRTTGAFNTWGYASGVQYRVTPGVQFRADNRDLYDNTKRNRGLLEKTEPGGRYMFAVVDEPVAQVDNDNSSVIQEPTMLNVTVETVQDFQDTRVDTSCLDSTIAVFTAHMENNEYSTGELSELLAYEQLHKNRKTIIDYLEEAIAQIE